jgi:hypothetical protein
MCGGPAKLTQQKRERGFCTDRERVSLMREDREIEERPMRDDREIHRE